MSVYNTPIEPDLYLLQLGFEKKDGRPICYFYVDSKKKSITACVNIDSLRRVAEDLNHVTRQTRKINSTLIVCRASAAFSVFVYWEIMGHDATVHKSFCIDFASVAVRCRAKDIAEAAHASAFAGLASSSPHSAQGKPRTHPYL